MKPGSRDAQRLFVGLFPPQEIVEHLQRRLTAVAASTQGIRWVDPERWHITLAFFGEVPVERVPTLCRSLDQLSTAHSFDIRLDGSGFFSSALWIGVEPDERGLPLAQLARAAQRAARAARIDVERKRWRGHLTVGRSRASRPTSIARLLQDYQSPFWTVRNVDLVHSITGPMPEYQSIHTVSLSD